MKQKLLDLLVLLKPKALVALDLLKALFLHLSQVAPLALGICLGYLLRGPIKLALDIAIPALKLLLKL